MGYVHRCSWCDWSREASSATMLEPHCRQCGGLLEAVQEGTVAARAPALHFVAPRLTPAFGRVLRFALVGLLMFAASRIGWDAAGLSLALAGAGIVGLFTVSLIVE